MYGRPGHGVKQHRGADKLGTMAKKKTQGPAPDVGQMFQLAEQYSVASNLLIKQSWGGTWGCGAPYLLVDSFAVELYLKCLFTQDTGKTAAHSHNHRELFDALASTTKTQIRDAFKRVIDADVVLKHLAAVNPDATIVLDFDRSLDAASDTFDKRRYAYEPPPAKEWYYAHLLRLAVRDVAKIDLRVSRLVDPQAGEPPRSIFG